MAEEAVFETFELKLYRYSPLGPVMTTILLGVFLYGSFLLNLAMIDSLSLYLQSPDGQAILRLGFILTLILCTAFAVNFYESRASTRDHGEMAKFLPDTASLYSNPRNRLRIATLVGAGLGFANTTFLIVSEAEGDILAFFSSLGLWFTPIMLLLFILLARGVTQTVAGGGALSRLIKEKLEVNLYRHHELTVFGHTAVRGAFVWLIFVGIILLFFTDGGVGGFAIPTLGISVSVAFYTFFKTMQPVRKKIRAAKQLELSTIRLRLEKARANLDDIKSVQEIPALVALEHRIETVPDWPIDLPTVAVMPLYMLVPVATLIAGAFLESLIGSIFF